MNISDIDPLENSYLKPKIIDENEIGYKLLILNKENQNIDTLFNEINNYKNEISKNYIWNNEKFTLDKPFLSDNWYICEGIIDYGDNSDDEWFIVYLIFEITKKFSGLVAAQITDIDGEFILIYLANYLPDWASNAANNCMLNRVFLFNGEIHMIPPATKPSQITYLPAHGPIKSSTEAVGIVFEFNNITCASEKMQTYLSKRLDMYKNYEKASFHQSTCKIPAKLAWILNQEDTKPFLSMSINRFCDKDPQDLKLCRVLNTFSAVDLIDFRVTFTKHLYSKLKYCEYNPDKRQNWPNISSSSTTEQRDRLQLGLKLTAAFELLAVLESKEGNLFESLEFKQYIKQLTRLGYFKDNLIDSAGYKELYQRAKDDFVNERIGESNKSNKQKLSEFIKNMPNNYKELIEKEVETKQKSQIDDSDDWLNIDQAHLDDYLEMYSRGDVNSTYDFHMIKSAFDKFLQKPKSEDLLTGVDYKSIQTNNDSENIDFNLDSIESCLNEFFTSKNKNKENKIDEGDDDDESDSFYEIGNDELSDESENLSQYIESMDQELERQKGLSRINKDDNDLNIDLNLVSNALESYSAQLGLTGPVSNILKSLGI